jgi:DNA processing protein
MDGPSPSATAIMALMRLKGIGRRAALRIADAPPPNFTYGSYRHTVFLHAFRERLLESDLVEAWERTEEQIHKSTSAGIVAYSIYDDGYPAQLRTIPDPPAVLFVKGSSAGLHGQAAVAIVGTREPTPYGAEVATRSGRTAAEDGFVVVSGLAHGCDTLGHEGCLEQKGVGVAVMAHGLDKVYPAANRKLADRLLDAGGCLVSEYPLGSAPARTAFPERDRIQSGLAGGVLVIETGEKGGTMHTVRAARAQHRLLACIAHPEKWQGEEKTRGNQKLIADRWATPIPDKQALTTFLARIRECVPRADEGRAPAAAGEQNLLAF